MADQVSADQGEETEEEVALPSVSTPVDYLEAAAHLAKRGELTEAVAAYRLAARQLPPCAALHNNIANLCLRLGHLEEALREFRTALTIASDHPSIRSNYLFSLLYQEAAPFSVLFREHLEWGRRHASQISREHRNTPEPERRLRIGYVSSSFRFHPKHFLIRPLLAAHDRRCFTVFCYSNAPPDRCTPSFRRASDEWLDIRGFTDDECAQRIARDRIDVLLDLDGHFGGNRLGVFALRPAPVQVSLPGYPFTTGVDAIGYRLTDDIVDPPDAPRSEYVEELVRLPGGFACYGPPRSAPTVTPPPALRNGYVTFACFNARQKYSNATLAAWAAILREAPGSRLLLHHAFNGQAEVTDEFRRPVLDVMRREGISGRRIEMIGGLSFQDHLAVYGRGDIMLDTYPYNGMTTTFESLWMGVPVVTLSGRSPASRVGASLLTRAGLPECVCTTADQYHRAAIRLASDLAKLIELRRTLRLRVRHTPAFNANAHSREVEDAYRRLWRRWCASN